MTSAVDAAIDDPLPPSVPRNAGHSVPAAALRDRRTANWVRSHGISVTACDDRDLDLVRSYGIRSRQVIFRCPAAPATLRRADDLGVSRFVVTTGAQLTRLATCAGRNHYVYLDDDAPLMLGDPKVKVIGLHTRVDDQDWAGSARKLVARSAVLLACGSMVRRIMLSGGPVELWLDVNCDRARQIVADVDAAVRAEAEYWHVPAPAVSMAALSTGN
ncbi:hypothetical protein QWI29_26505 [Mycolicibacterium neoaurum]|uniref:hypothetical protein n=1 Tax=Mycolicibacterium neoaurum TaxID=1795 RepID=UPI0026714585|nr:hypothetical protein [Mycolicibacterium neoaurum]MDO3403614.1 hypothetical protein [Mycolicibacterium neoaurum]